ncbi:MAG TPA: hypothetical protein VFV38_33845 [Ktedonobacteraceae bacterium]|nr:hypothetical protein [Ktedonobacteraceae bacterium]
MKWYPYEHDFGNAEICGVFLSSKNQTVSTSIPAAFCVAIKHAYASAKGGGKKKAATYPPLILFLLKKSSRWSGGGSLRRRRYRFIRGRDLVAK